MDRETLSDMVKLKFSSRKAGGPDIDLVKLASDPVYADATLRAIENLPFESLVLLAMTLRDKFGLLTAMPVVPAGEEVCVERKVETPPQRYMSGARS